MAKLDVNGRALGVDVAGDTPLLWTLRDGPGGVDSLHSRDEVEGSSVMF